MGAELMATREPGFEAAAARAPARAPGGALLLLLLALCPLPARAQEPPPVNPPNQDELDFQARTSLAIGSGARAFGMGGAFLARADDATAASWNPAGLSYLRLPEFSIVGSWGSLDEQVLGDAAGALTFEDNSSTGATPDFASVTYPFEIRGRSGSAQLSFQRVLAFQGDRTIVRGPSVLELESQGGFDTLALGTGVQISQRFRIGATVNRWFNGFRQTRQRTTDRPSDQTVNFGLSGWNVNVGAIWSPMPDVNLAVSGRTRFTGKVSLDRTRLDPPFGDRLETTTNGYSSEAVRLDFPGAIGAGVSWRARSTLTLSADYTRTFWATASIHNFFTLPVTGEPVPPDDVFDELPYPALDRPQTDTDQLRLGFEHVVLGRRVKVPLRFGLFTDRQYFFAEDGSIPRFYGFTLGAGVLAGPMLFDLAYVYEGGSYAASSETTNQASVRIWRVYASLIYRHQSQR
jgi:hypothetical protein